VLFGQVLFISHHAAHSFTVGCLLAVLLLTDFAGTKPAISGSWNDTSDKDFLGGILLGIHFGTPF
jgi:hypothetical protein